MEDQNNSAEKSQTQTSNKSFAGQDSNKRDSAIHAGKTSQESQKSQGAQKYGNQSSEIEDDKKSDSSSSRSSTGQSQSGSGQANKSR